MSENQKNYVGSSFVSDYKGEFNGFTTYFTLADLEELKKFMSEDGRVGVGVRFAKDPKKAYATMFTPKVREPKAEEASQSTGAADDLPF